MIRPLRLTSMVRQHVSQKRGRLLNFIGAKLIFWEMQIINVKLMLRVVWMPLFGNIKAHSEYLYLGMHPLVASHLFLVQYLQKDQYWL